MVRTTVMLPERLKAQAEQRAREEGISFGELVRRSLRARIRRQPDEIREDPLFRDEEVYSGPSPSDISSRHNSYLYDEEL